MLVAHLCQQLATPSGKKENLLVAMAGKLPVPSEVDAQNIARPNVEQTSIEYQKALTEVRRKIREQKEREILELEEEAMKQYISHFSVDRQGNVKKDKEVIINILTLKVQSNAPPEDNSDIANMIDGAVSANLNNKFVAMSEKFESMINSCLDRIEAKFGKQFSGNDILMHILLILKILEISH
jgi:E3 ubiquitin-protein ligase DOA10